MVRRLLPLVALGALFGAGCVPVTDPVGDIDKAEPNKELLGTWDSSGGEEWVVDRPEVKGNPKGLMRIRIVEGDKTKETMWVFTAVVGKRTYANLLIGEGKTTYADLSTEGAYEKWAKRGGRYWVGLLTFKGDELALDGGNEKAFDALMEKEKIATADGHYKTGAGWLAKYLDKHGPDAVFDGKHTLKYARAKKK